MTHHPSRRHVPQPLGAIGFVGCSIALAWGCGAPSGASSSSSIEGSFATESGTVAFVSVQQSPQVADVALQVDGLQFDAHFDFGEGRVVLDGHGQALSRAAHQALAQAVSAPPEALGVAGELGSVEQQALYAALASWQQSGGVALDRWEIDLEPSVDSAEKSRFDDGISCVRRGARYVVSFDSGEANLKEYVVQADTKDCNGRCGPSCTPLSPYDMWTLDCLEHDTCCRESDSPDCWVPLGQCGDEYRHATEDFLRGFNPFSRHCGG